MKNNYSEDMYGIKRGQLYQITFEKQNTAVTTIKGIIENMNSNQIIIRVDEEDLYILRYKNIIEMLPINAKKDIDVLTNLEESIREMYAMRNGKMKKISYWEAIGDLEKEDKEGKIFTESELRKFDLNKLLELSIENKLKAIEIIDKDGHSNEKVIDIYIFGGLSMIELDTICSGIVSSEDIIIFRKTITDSIIEERKMSNDRIKG